LDPSFQILLKAASIIGQYFSVEDLSHLVDTDHENPELRRILLTKDKYDFLLQQPQQTVTSSSSSSHSPGTDFMFRHITIMNAIYESQAYAARSALHLQYALHLESRVNEQNREHLLPLLSFHFGRSNDIEKHVIYKEELG
jgi:predicted ATPase